MDRAAIAASYFFDLRVTPRKVAGLPPEALPLLLEEAYRAQAMLVERMLARSGGRPIGYKIAATNVAAQKQLDVAGPFFGTLLSSSTHPSPAALPAAGFTIRCVEAEFGFEIGADVPETDVPYTDVTVKPFIAAAIPAIEVVDHRFHDWQLVGAPTLAADNAIHGAWVEGRPVRDWHDFDLSRHPVAVYVNGELSRTGSGAAVLGNPLNVVAWLANELPKFGRRLRRGDKISTGTSAEVYLANPGDRIAADFGSLGRVEISFA